MLELKETKHGTEHEFLQYCYCNNTIMFLTFHFQKSKFMSVVPTFLTIKSVLCEMKQQMSFHHITFLPSF